MTDQLIALHDTQVELDAPAITVTPAAASKILELLQQRNLPSHALRVFVSGGGCSGLQYGMAFEGNPQEFDTVIEAQPGVRLVVDPTSIMYVGGATIDFVDSLMGGGFRIENPNAVSSCGCGNSFRTKAQTDTSESEAEAHEGCNCHH